MAVNTIKNRDDFTSFGVSLEEAFLSTLLANVHKNTFYAKQNELIAESEIIHRAMLMSDPEFYGKALVYARMTGLMRMQPIFGLALLAADAQKYDLLDRVFAQVIVIPDDLKDFYARYMQFKGTDTQGGRHVKRLAGNWLRDNLTPYWTIKYGAAEKGGYSLREIFITTHPKGPNNPLIEYLIRGPDNVAMLPDQVIWFEMLKTAKTPQEKIVAITQGRLPFNVVESFVGDNPDIWLAMANQMPTQAMLKHLDSFARHGILGKMREPLELALTPQAIHNSKLLPYQVLAAYPFASEPWLKTLIENAAESAFTNFPDIPGETRIALDTSGSMIDDRKMWDTSRIYAMALADKTKRNVLTFDVHVGEITPTNKAGCLLKQALEIEACEDRGIKSRDVLYFGNDSHGTWTSGPVEFLIRQKTRIDNLIVITDGQQNQGRSFADAIQDYRAQFNPDLKTFTIDVSPYLNAIADPTSSLDYRIAGWSDRVLSVIPSLAGGGKNTVELIRNMKI